MAAIKPIEGRSVHQIQSGQVIGDGLSSAVKELVENSLDAHATSIEVRFKNHGLDALEVIDNGDGIAPDNYESLALKHYTSKLRSYSDLESVTTFGFRGEALSSLCALSDVHVITATADEAPKGTRLEFAVSGQLKSRAVAAASKGTTVVVANLFKTLPVRRKELERNVKRDYARVMGLLQAYASICVGVKFSVFNQPLKGKRTPVFATKGNPTTRENISNVFGAKVMAALVPLDLQFEMQPTHTAAVAKVLGKPTESTQVKIVGHISRPVVGEGRQAPDRQMFFVNGRPCNLPQIARAINEVYKTYNVTQSPFIFADIQLDTNAYDVNVSPDKRTILLHDQTQMLESLKDSLTELFEKHEQTVPQSQLGMSTPKLPAFKQLSLKRSASSPSMMLESSPLASGSNHAASRQASSPVPRDLAGETGMRNTDEEDETSVVLQRQNPINLDRSLSSPVPRRYARESTPPRASGDDKGTGSSPVNTNSEQKLNEAAPIGHPNVQSDFNRNVPFKPPTKVAPSADRRTERPFQASTTVDEVATSLLRGDSLDEELHLNPDVPSSPPQSQSERLPATQRTLFRSSRRKDTATIQIGDRPAVTSTGSPAKRARLSDDDEIGPQKTRVLTSRRLASTLGRFALPGSQIISAPTEDSDESGPDEIEKDAELNDKGPEDEESTSSPMEIEVSTQGVTAGQSAPQPRENRENSPPLFPSNAALDEPDTDVDMEEAEADVEAEANEAEPKIKQEDDDDGDYTPKSTQAQAKARSARILAEAEKAEIPELSVPASTLLERAFRLLEGSRNSSLKNLTSTQTCTFPNILTSIGTLRDALTEVSPVSTSKSDGLLADDTAAEERLTLTVTKADFGRMQIKGQFNRGFILATRGEDLFIIDQHASDEKYNFETLQATTVVQHQPLVVPRPLELMAMDEVAVLDSLAVLKRNGFVVGADPEAAPGHRCHLLSLPMSRETVFGVEDLEELIHLIHQNPGSMTVRCSKVRSMFAMRACRRSVMVGKALPTKAMEKIVRHMGELDKPWNCPHGRPTMRHLTTLGGFASWSERRNGGGLRWGGDTWREVTEMYAADQP